VVPLESLGALVSVLTVKPVPKLTPFIIDLPMLSAVVKSPAVVSVQTTLH
jgi:hypothetical protein